MNNIKALSQKLLYDNIDYLRTGLLEHGYTAEQIDAFLGDNYVTLKARKPTSYEFSLYHDPSYVYPAEVQTVLNAIESFFNTNLNEDNDKQISYTTVEVVYAKASNPDK